MEQSTGTVEIGTIRNLLNGLILLQNHLRLYGRNNANVAQTTTKLLDWLSRLFADTAAVTLYVAGHGFMHGDGFVDRANRHFEKFANCLFTHGIATLTLHRDISAEELHEFLLLIARKPAETWSDGGIDHCLRMRGIEHLTVREMAEEDFLLMESASETDREQLQAQQSALWEEFALSLLHGLRLAEAPEDLADRFDPAELAAKISEFLEQCPEAAKLTFARDASRFLMAVKHEKVRIYRAAALGKLAAFVNRLTPGLRQMLLDNVFQLNLDAELAEGFLSGLSDQVILDAFRQATLGKGYVPPMMLKLLGRLARDRQLIEPSAMPDAAGDPSDTAGQITELFRKDDFDKYVPAEYQQALLAIVRKEGLPTQTTAALDKLKATLDPGAQEHHLGAIIFAILQESLDLKHLEGFRSNLFATLNFYLATHSYAHIRKFYEQCRSEAARAELLAEVQDYMASPRFTKGVLDALPQLSRENLEDAWALIIILQTPFIEPLLDRLGTENNRATRLAYLKVLIQIGLPCIPPAVARLSDPRWFVVRNMLYLLRELGDATVLPEVRHCLQYPHAKVQQEALRTCLLFRDEQATPFLLQNLASPSPEDLISTINLASLSQDARVVARLFELLQTGTLFNYQLEVKRAAVRALAVNAPQQSLPVFAALLKSRSFLQARAHEAIKLEILAAFEKYPAESVKPLLETQVRSGSAEAARVAQNTLRKLGGGGGQ